MNTPNQPASPSVSDRAVALARDVRLLAVDVDGVLTDGSIFIDSDGRETKRFHAHDGVALRLCEKTSIITAVVTGRTSSSLLHRLADLGVRHVIQGSKDKAAAVDKLTEITGVTAKNMCFVGDDWPDLPALRKVGFPVAVANASPETKAIAAMVTVAGGGFGAVREVVEHILRTQGQFGRALAMYDGAHG